MRWFDRSLVRVELARLQGAVQTLVTTTAASDADKEARIRSLERWRYSQPVTAIAALAALVSTFFHH